MRYNNKLIFHLVNLSNYLYQANIILMIGLLVWVILFYWNLSMSLVVPTGDGAIPMSFYSYLYSGYLTYGKMIFWNPFLLGGGIDNVIACIYMGFSPLNPILQLWLPISKLLHLEIIRSFYFYYLIHIYVTGLAGYFLGIRHLFKNRFTSAFFAILLTGSGFFVCMMGLMYYIVPFSWFLVTIYFGFEALNSNRLQDFFLLALSVSIFVINGPTVVIPSAVFIAVLFSMFVGQQLKTTGLRRYLTKKRIINFVFLAIAFVLLITAPMMLYFNFVETDGYHLTGDPSVYFFGKHDELQDSGAFQDFYLFINIFNPNRELGRWFRYGNGGLWYNCFFYLGFVCPLLIGLGIYFFSRRRDLRPLFISLFSAFLVAIYFTQGHSFIRSINHNLSLLLKYPKFVMPLPLFFFIVMASYGFHTLFSLDEFPPAHKKYIKTAFIAGIPLLIVFVSILALFLNKFIPGLNVSDPKDPYFSVYISSISYCLFVGFLYLIPVAMNSKKLFLAVMIFDLFFFLSASWPLMKYPFERVEQSFDLLHINAKSKFRMPVTINYSMASVYPGMHFAVGPTLFRETAIPDVSMSLINNRRAYWDNWILSELYQHDTNRYDALNIIGVSRKRYFMTSNIFVVDSYDDIQSKLQEVYATFRKEFGQPLSIDEPVVISKTENSVLNTKTIKVPNTSQVNIVNDELQYLSSLPRPIDIKTVTIRYSDLDIVIKNDDFKRQVYEYEKDLPTMFGTITESNTKENLCLLISDSQGIYYYPVVSDIFNFTPYNPLSNHGYTIPYSHFYATYLNENNKLRLFLRADDLTPQSSIKLQYSDNCFWLSGDTKFQSTTITLKPKDFAFNRSDNDLVEFVSPKLAEGAFPTYFGEYINRSILTTPSNDKMKYASDDDLKDMRYQLDNGILKVFKDIKQGPFITEDVSVTYSTFSEQPTIKNQQIKIIHEDPDYLKFEVNSPPKSLFISRNVYTADWEARVDGKVADTYIINGLYTGVGVPEGNHIVELKYNPKWLKLAIRLMYFHTLLIPLVLLIIAIKKQRIKPTTKTLEIDR